MQIVWLGQGGLLFVSEKKKILIDPYLSNSMRLIDKMFKRRVKIKKKLFKISPDVIILTNSHQDHADSRTLSKFLSKKSKKKVTVLACREAYEKLFSSKDFTKANPFVFGCGDEWTFDTLHIKGVRARTDDAGAFGLLITDQVESKQYYIASNTLYNESIFEDVPEGLFASFSPISGKYGCMNMTDAIRFAKRINAEYSVPINYGMFDTIDADEFRVPGKVIPKPNRAIEFNILPFQSFFAPKVFDSRFNEKKKKPKKKEVIVVESEISEEDIASIVLEDTIEVPVPPTEEEVPVGDATEGAES